MGIRLNPLPTEHLKPHLSPQKRLFYVFGLVRNLSRNVAASLAKVLLLGHMDYTPTIEL